MSYLKKNAICIIIILVIIYTAVQVTVNKYENYLTGLWVGNSAFLKKAELKDFQLFIAPTENGCRQGYLIITNLDGNFISNQAITIYSKQCWQSTISSMFQSKDDKYKKYSLNIDYEDSEDSNHPIPDNIKLTLSMLNGTLTLYDDKKVYAFMEKDLVSSAAAVEAYSE